MINSIVKRFSIQISFEIGKFFRHINEKALKFVVDILHSAKNLTKTFLAKLLELMSNKAISFEIYNA